MRKTPLYEERYLLLTPEDTELAELPVATWAQVAALPLCLLSPEMRNRRIMDGFFTDDGVTAAPAIESDTVSGLYSHVPRNHWSTVISHAWLHMFGVPDGMRVVPLKGPAHGAAGRPGDRRRAVPSPYWPGRCSTSPGRPAYTTR